MTPASTREKIPNFYHTVLNKLLPNTVNTLNPIQGYFGVGITGRLF